MQIRLTVQFPSQKVCFFTKEERFMSESERKLYGLCLYPGDRTTPAELLCCLTGTCTNSVNRGRIADRAADFLLVPLHSSSQTPDNECKLRFFFSFMLFTSTEKSTPFVTCERLSVSSGRWSSTVSCSRWTLNSPLVSSGLTFWAFLQELIWIHFAHLTSTEWIQLNT